LVFRQSDSSALLLVDMEPNKKEPIEDTSDTTNPKAVAKQPTATTSSYNGWLVSNIFYKRCLAVVGHYVVGVFALLLSVSLVGFIVLILSSLFN